MKVKSSKFILVTVIFLVAILTVAGILIGWNFKSKVSFAESANTKVGQSMKVIGEVERSLPEVSNEGLSRYPVYGTALGTTTEERNQIIKENNDLLASDSTYDSMDENGNLYLNGEPTGRKLYKHTAAVGMYYGDVDDNEPAVIKQISISPRPLGNYITGLYAPAGEVIKIEISQEDLDATGGLKITIGQASQTNELNNIWAARELNRMPVIANIMTVSTTTAYVGYFLGGPIYVTPIKSAEFTVTISGAVEYMHYIYGLTTKEEFERMKSFSAPYFDLEIWDNSVRHSGTRKYANVDYENLTKVAELWEKISRTSKQVPTGSKANIGIDILYDPFIAAGSAVALVGRNWCNVPPDWMSGALNYQEFVSSGAWGVIHEYNHHFQCFGFAYNDEVSNNAISLLSYILYTNISANRSYNDSTLSGWNRFTDPSRSLRETKSNDAKGTVQNSLNSYADIIHTFGVDVFITATKYNPNKYGADSWYQALCEATGYDMTYYFEELLNQTISEGMKAQYNTGERPIFVPVASIYQTGRSFYQGEQEVFAETVKPFEIPRGENFTLDFNQYLIVPNDFSFTIKSVSQPQNGRIEKTGDNVYVYIPGEETYSGTFKVALSLQNDNITTPDITLTINLKQKNDDDNKDFTSETVYPRNYTYSKDLNADFTKQSIVSYENFTSWDNSGIYDIENIIDGDKSTAFHSNRDNIVSVDNPFILTVDLGEMALYNKMTITGYTNSQRHMPITFDLYVGTSLDNMHLAGSYKNLTYSNRTLAVNFDEQEMRYYKLVITDTDTHKYVAINQIDFSYSLSDMKEYTPDIFNYYSYRFGKLNFSKMYMLSTYGFCISGNGYIKYTFTGTQIAFNVRQNEECKIKISLDGKSTTLTLNAQSEKTLAYYSSLLKEGKHTLEIKVLKGMLTIESVAIK